MNKIADQIASQLQLLVGLKLSIARRAADMRVLHFGTIREVESRRLSGEKKDGRKGTVGDFALHIQCAWRIEDQSGIVTGRTDLWKPAEDNPDIDWDTWDYDKDESLQDKRIGYLLGGYDAETRSSVNNSDLLVVEGFQTDDYGGVTLFLSGGYRLVIFPAGSQGEDWRLFPPGTKGNHLVISGGMIEESP